MTDARALAPMLLEEAVDPMLLIGPNQEVIWQNRAARTLFGAARDATSCGLLLHCQTRSGRLLMDGPGCHGRCALKARQSLPSVNMVVVTIDGTRLAVNASYTFLEAVGDHLLISLRDLSGQLRWLERTVARAQKEAVVAERRRLARELHDGLGQSLTTLCLTARLLLARLDEGKREGVRRSAELLYGAAEQAKKELREAIQGLIQPRAVELTAVLDEALASVGDLLPAKRQVIEGVSGVGVSAEVRHELLQILREALTNVIRHSQARHLILRLLPRPNGVRLEIEDDGVGPDTCVSRSRDHFGILFMRERAKVLGARLSIRRNRQGGTTVSLLLPRNRLMPTGAPNRGEATRHTPHVPGGGATP